MTVETHRPAGPADDAEVVDAEVVEETRLDRLKARLGPHRERARAGWSEQRARVAKRVHDWYATAELSDVQLGEDVVHARRRRNSQADRNLIREAARLKGRLAEARRHAAARVGDTDARSREVEQITGDLAAVEARMEERHAEGPALAVEPATPADINRARWMRKAQRVALTVGGGYAALQGAAVEPAMLLGALAAGPFGWWYLARPFDNEDQEQQAESAGQAPASRVSLVKQMPVAGAAPQHAVPEEPKVPDFNAPPPPALSQEVLTRALRDIGAIKADDVVTVLAAPPFGADGTATIVADLPSGVTVAAVKKKQEALAGALGRDVSMIDLEKAGAAGRLSLWMCDSDPFEPPRPSPLLGVSGPLDAYGDGVPVAWAKRGNAVRLPVKNANFVIAGMTRSGKGVGAANLVTGSALDVRINHRIVAGKSNGEWDPHAKTNVAATYFKPSPRRLLALTEALLADMDRRNDVLGELGKSKLTAASIDRLGGIELLVIDELATYTRPGSHPDRDQLLENLLKLSAVAAGAGILMVLITQYPEADVIPQGLAMNCGTRWAMRVDNATQSNAILGGGSAGAGRDASKFDPPLPGLGWLVNPFAGVTDLARSFDLDEDERDEVTAVLTRAAGLRSDAGRLTGQWEDPIEAHLVRATGLSSAAGGPKHDGIPGRALTNLPPEKRAALETAGRALRAMDELGRDAQLDEMADRIGGMTADELGSQLRTAGAGPTVKVSIDGRRVQGYRRDTLRDLLDGPG